MKRYFIAGLLVCLPIIITVLILRFVVNLLDGIIELIPHAYQPQQLFGFHFPGIGVIVAILLIFLVGLLTTNFLGRWLLKLWNELLEHIPVVRSIYSAIKQVLDTMFSSDKQSFRKVLLVEYPRKGVWSIAFQTSEGFNQVPGQPDVVTAFIPTTPNPTSGFLILLPRSDVTELDISVEDAFKMVVSLGVVMPAEGVTQHLPNSKPD